MGKHFVLECRKTTVFGKAGTEIHENHDFSIFKNFPSIFKFFTDFFVILQNLLFFIFPAKF